MNDFKATSDNEKRSIVNMVDDALARLAVAKTSRVALVFQHEADENPLPEILDYLETLNAQAEHLFTTPLMRTNGQHVVMRELIVKSRAYPPWDGSVE